MSHELLLAYLDLLSSECLQLWLLSKGESVDEDLSASSDRHFEVVTILLNLRDTLDVFAFLDEFIRKTLDTNTTSKKPLQVISHFLPDSCKLTQTRQVR